MSDKSICDVEHVHPHAVKSVAESIPSDLLISNLSEMFKLLSDPTRLKIVLALLENELCVCDICSVVGMTQSAASHQLRILRNAHLAKFKRVGKMVYYSIEDEHVSTIIKIALTHIQHTHY